MPASSAMANQPASLSGFFSIIVAATFLGVILLLVFLAGSAISHSSTANVNAATSATASLAQQGAYGEFLAHQIISCAKDNVTLPSAPAAAVHACASSVLTTIGLNQGVTGLVTAQAMYAKAGLGSTN